MRRDLIHEMTGIHVDHLGFYLARLQVNLQSEIFSHLANDSKLGIRGGISVQEGFSD